MTENIENSEVISDEVMTLTEIASYLKVSEKTILRMAKEGDIPGAKISNQWRFLKEVVVDWLTTKMQVAQRDDLIKIIQTGKKIIPITRLISEDRVLLDIKSGDKESVLKQLVQPLVAQGIVADEEGYIQMLLHRESMVSTAFGHGVAFPHAREPQDKLITESCIVLGVCKEGVDFDSLDGEKTYVFALICAMSEIVHLRLMAKVSLMLRKKDAIAEILSIKKRRDLISLLIEADLDLFAQYQGDDAETKSGVN